MERRVRGALGIASFAICALFGTGVYAAALETPASAAERSIPSAASTTTWPDKDLLAFVGNSGTTLRFNPEYAADARMHGAKEVIVFHPRSLGLTLESDSFRPEEFEKLGLIELVILLKSEAHAKTLAALCDHRLFALHEMSGVKYQRHDCERGAGCPIVGVDWPADTCEFDITSPFRLQQVYSEDASHYYLLSSGMDLGDPRAVDVTLSLMRSLSGPQAEVSPKYNAVKPPENNRWLPEPHLAGWLIAASSIILFGGLLPLRWGLRRRRLVLSIGLSSAMAFTFYGLIFTGAANWFGVTTVNVLVGIGAPAALGAILASWVVARRLNAVNVPTSVFATAVACSPILVLAFLAGNDRPAAIASDGPFFSYLIMFPAGLLAGIVLALSMRFAEGGRNGAA